jgi:cystine transport system substrate-binding protein
MNPEPPVRTRLSVTIALATALLLTSCGGNSGARGGSASGSSGVLRVATEGTYAPFSFHDPGSNDLTGYDVEVAKAVGAKLGKKVEFSETQFDSIFAAWSPTGTTSSPIRSPSTPSVRRSTCSPPRTPFRAASS